MNRLSFIAVKEIRKVFFFDISGVLNPLRKDWQKGKQDGKVKYAREVLGIEDESILQQAYELGVVPYLKYLADILSPEDFNLLDYSLYAEYVYFSENLDQYYVKDPMLQEFFEDIDYEETDIFVLSSSYIGNIERFLKFQNIYDYFGDSNIISIDRLNDRFINPHDLIKKPHPEAFAKACEIAEVQATDECYFIDDQIKNLTGAESSSGWIGIKSNIGTIHLDEVNVSSFPEVNSLHQVKELVPLMFHSTKESYRNMSVLDEETYYQRNLEIRKLLDDPDLCGECPCPNRLCERYGDCESCVRLHRIHKGHLPYCMHELIMDSVHCLAEMVECNLEVRPRTSDEHWEYVRKRDMEE